MFTLINSGVNDGRIYVEYHLCESGTPFLMKEFFIIQNMLLFCSNNLVCSLMHKTFQNNN